MGRRSENIEDRRGMGLPGGGMGLPGGSGGLRRAGLGGIGLVVVVVLAIFLGVDPSQLLQGGLDSGTYAPDSPSGTSSSADPELRDFVSVVLADTEDTWREQFQQMNLTYREPTLVLFNGGVQSACGFAETATGPFYCPGDKLVYIDLGFYDDLRTQLGAKGGRFDPGDAPSALTAIGRMAFGPDIFDLLEDIRGTQAPGVDLDDVPALQRLARGGRLVGVLAAGPFYDVGVPEGYADALARLT